MRWLGRMIVETSDTCETVEKPVEPQATVSPPATRRIDDTVARAKTMLTAGDIDGVLGLLADALANELALQRRLNELLARRYKSSEKVDVSQLALLLGALDGSASEAEADTDDSDEARAAAESARKLAEADAGIRMVANLDDLGDEGDKKKAKDKNPHPGPARRPFPDKLRRVVNPIRVPAHERACPCCSGEQEVVGFEVTEVLELHPAELIVRQDQREKLGCPLCDGPLCRAPAPDKVVKKGRMGAGLIATILVEKYRDGLPLHRQVERFGRLGVSIPLSTLVDQVGHASKAAKVLVDVAATEVLASDVLVCDATGLPVLDGKNGRGKRQGSLYAYVGDGRVCVYRYTSTGRKTRQRPDEQGPEDFLATRVGPIVADAAPILTATFAREDVIECNCNTHARRYFVKALDGGDSRAALIVGAYRRLYEVERDAKTMNDEDRQALRNTRSRPVFNVILKWCQAYHAAVPPATKLGRAIAYFINHHVALSRYLDNGAIPIDTNLVERQHVRVALTRKNYLFAGSDLGGHRAANIYTLLGSCALNDVAPIEYLTDVLPRLRPDMTADEARELLPDRWKAARADG